MSKRPTKATGLVARPQPSRSLNVRIDPALYFVAKLLATAAGIQVTEFARSAIEHDIPQRKAQADYAIQLLESAKHSSSAALEPAEQPAPPDDDPVAPFELGEGASRQINLALPADLITTIQLLAVADGVSLPAFVERALLAYMRSLKSDKELGQLHAARAIADLKAVNGVVQGLDDRRIGGDSR